MSANTGMSKVTNISNGRALLTENDISEIILISLVAICFHLDFCYLQQEELSEGKMKNLQKKNTGKFINVFLLITSEMPLLLKGVDIFK